jgi:tight adherence protein B
MAGLPILLLLVLSRLEPEAMDRLWSTALGWAVLLLIFVLECLGTVWIRRVIAVEV